MLTSDAMADLPPLPKKSPETLAEIGSLNDRATQKLIREILADRPHTQFHFTLGRIMERLQEENSVLVSETRRPVPAVAWAARNIIELRIWTRFVCQSRTNLDRFANDLATTFAPTLRAQLRLLNDLANKVPNPIRPSAGQYKKLADFQNWRTEIGLDAEGPLMARTCARGVGLEKEYLAISNVTSPLIHPSAISVLRAFDIEEYRDSLTGHGLVTASELIIDARTHLERSGFKPGR